MSLTTLSSSTTNSKYETNKEGKQNVQKTFYCHLPELIVTQPFKSYNCLFSPEKVDGPESSMRRTIRPIL